MTKKSDCYIDIRDIRLRYQRLCYQDRYIYRHKFINNHVPYSECRVDWIMRILDWAGKDARTENFMVYHSRDNLDVPYP